MDLEKLEKMAKLVLADLSGRDSMTHLVSFPAKVAQFKNLMVIAHRALPDHLQLFKSINKSLQDFQIIDARYTIMHILDIVEIEKATETKIKEMKIFEGAKEKLKQASLSFRKDDFPSAFHSLNTALELVLKDKLGIPTTITNINTSKIIDVLIKHKVEPYVYLSETKKRVLMIDNKIKHQGYSPSKIDCINGMKVMEELISKLRGKEIKLTEEIRNKIYQGL